MALTNSIIDHVKGIVEDIDIKMLNYAAIARRTIEQLKDNPEFAKYLMDTGSGARLYSQLLQLLEKVEETKDTGNRLTNGVIAQFLSKQRLINENGR